MKTKQKMLKRAISISGFIIIAIFIFISDDQQQKAFQNVRDAYELYETGEFNMAYELFYDYYSHTDSRIYWKLIECVNGRESIYTRQSVLKKMNDCLDAIKNDEHL